MEQIKQNEQIGEFGSDFYTPATVVVKSTFYNLAHNMCSLRMVR